MNLHRTLIGLTLCLLVLPSYANPYQQYPVSRSDIQSSPAAVLKQGIEQLTNFLASSAGPNTPPLELFLDKNIAPFFDFTYMAKWTAGARAQFMSREQGVAMEQKLRRLFLKAMVDKLAEYRHGRVQYLRPSGNPQTGEVTLRLMAFQQGSPYPQRLSFRMYRSNQGWKVFDVSSNGQSALSFFRTQFALEERPRMQAPYAINPVMRQLGRQQGYRPY